MRTLRQFSYLGTATLLTATLGVLSGCASSVGGDGTGAAPGTGADSGTGGSTAGGGGGGGAGSGAAGPGTGGTGTAGSGGVPIVTGCEPGIPATSQVPRLTNLSYGNAVKDILGLEAFSDGSKPSDMLGADSQGPMDPYMWTAYKSAAQKIATEVMGSDLKGNFMTCDPAAGASCYQETITSFGRKMFRRPLEQTEVDSYMRLTALEPAGTPEEIAETILYAFLTAPSFIMVPEVAEGTESPGMQVPLSSHQVAMRLSLAIWGSVPDEILSKAADDGLLTTKEQIMEQAARMIQDRDRAAAQLVAAHMKYLNVSDSTHWWDNVPDSTIYPEYSERSLPVLQQEMDMFFEYLAFNGGTFKDLFLSNVGFVNQDTAAIYGLNPADYGPEIEQVEYPAGQRPGFLTRAGFLVSKAYPTFTSPILRGVSVTIDILGINPGPPSPDAFTTPLPDREYTTQRGVIDALTEGKSCKACHTLFVNPPGFVLEQYNAAGVFQETDTSYKPDGSGVLGGQVNTTATVTFSDTNVMEVNSPQEMMEQIAQEDEAARLYAQKLVSFVMNRLPNNNDACLVDALAAKLSTMDNYTILNTFSDMAQADSFLARTVGSN